MSGAGDNNRESPVVKPSITGDGDGVLAKHETSGDYRFHRGFARIPRKRPHGFSPRTRPISKPSSARKAHDSYVKDAFHRYLIHRRKGRGLPHPAGHQGRRASQVHGPAREIRHHPLPAPSRDGGQRRRRASMASTKPSTSGSPSAMSSTTTSSRRTFPTTNG